MNLHASSTLSHNTQQPQRKTTVLGLETDANDGDTAI